MNKNIKKIIAVVVVALLISGTTVSKVNSAEASNWKTEYKKVLKNWHIIEENQDFSYLEHYFGDGYNYNSYFICDIDKNGVPELFLYSKTMRLTTVLTYNKKLMVLNYTEIYGLNKSQKTIVQKGHWHGAGGSGDKEYSFYKIKKNKEFTLSGYIDLLNNRYTVYKNGDYSSGTKKEYMSQYNKYVKNCKKINQFKKYKLSNTKGLNKQQ